MGRSKRRLARNSSPVVIAPGAFGDTPKTVPLTMGVGGETIGTATFKPDGTIDAQIDSNPQMFKVDLSNVSIMPTGTRWSDE